MDPTHLDQTQAQLADLGRRASAVFGAEPTATQVKTFHTHDGSVGARLAGTAGTRVSVVVEMVVRVGRKDHDLVVRGHDATLGGAIAAIETQLREEVQALSARRDAAERALLPR